MREAVVVSAVRTALGRAGGALRNVRPEHTGAEGVKGAINRVKGLKSDDIDEVVVGCSFPEAEMGLNLGRIIVLKAGLPNHVSGMTVNRFCASGLEGIAISC